MWILQGLVLCWSIALVTFTSVGVLNFDDTGKFGLMEDFNKFGRVFMYVVFWPCFLLSILTSFIATLFTYEPSRKHHNQHRKKATFVSEWIYRFKRT